MRRPDYKPRKDIIEHEIESYLIDLCEKRVWLCEKTTRPGALGFPDRCIIANGRVVFVELKRPDHKPRKAQIHVLKRLRAHNADAVVVHDADTADLLVQLIENNKEIFIENETSFYVTDRKK